MTPTKNPTTGPTTNLTMSPTYFSTLFPTQSPIEEPGPSDLLFWGARQSIGLVNPSGDIVVPNNTEELVRDASAGLNYTLVILNNGAAAVAGYIESSYDGHFGVEPPILSQGVFPLRTIPLVENMIGLRMTAPQFKVVVAGVENPDAESSGLMHSVFIDTDGNVYATGHNNKGQLCLGNEVPTRIPTQIKLPGNERAVSAAVGAEFTLIVTNLGRVYGCGSNEFGQLGLGNNVIKRDQPEEITALSDVRSVSSGLDFSLIRTNEGLFVMGKNTVGMSKVDEMYPNLFLCSTKHSTIFVLLHTCLLPQVKYTLIMQEVHKEHLGKYLMIL